MPPIASGGFSTSSSGAISSSLAVGSSGGTVSASARPLPREAAWLKSKRMPERIPLLDLRAEYHELKSEIDAAVSRVLESGQFILGPEVTGLEEEFASYCNVKHAIGVNSGTSALHLALLGAGIE